LSSLPVIVGFGGVNPAGRSSFHHGYRRMVTDVLDAESKQQTYTSLAMMMGLLKYDNGQYLTAQDESVDLARWLQDHQAYIDQHTLVRKLETNLFDPASIYLQKAVRIMPNHGEAATFTLRKRDLPSLIPDNWQVKDLGDGEFEIHAEGGFQALLPDHRSSLVNSAGQLPSGFNPAGLYASRNHPRGLQLSVYAASDAVQSVGIDWQTIVDSVSPDQISVYSSSSMSQLDQNGNGGLMQAALMGKRVTSKQLPLGFAEMPADFINAYVLGSVGGTAGLIGACATFLYNLQQGLQDIRSGKKRVVVVGNSEAPITPEVIEGYRTMGALADDASLLKLDPGADAVNHRRACRPFSDNCGFTLSEGAQYVVLFDDKLALELGATIYGGVADVFVNADGYKKSISSPGVGNYITMAKAMAAAQSLVGDNGLQRSFVMAHGTGTPQNRVTESHILNEVAKTFGVQDWPVAAVKSYLGHTLGVASADQLITSLGVWQYGIVPGITTIDHVASDVHNSNLNILQQHLQGEADGFDAAVLNAKGFGGNNASATVLAPHVVKRMLTARHGAAQMTAYQGLNESVRETAAAYDQQATLGQAAQIYRFGEGVRSGDDVSMTRDSLSIDGYANSIDLGWDNPYSDCQ